jgi:hypothetical protein
VAGTNPGFDSGAFRDAIHFVFDMASPPDDAQQVAFHFAPQLIYTGSVDGESVPFDPDSTVQRVVPPPVKVLCGVEYFNETGERTAFGEILPTRVETTLLDEDYAKVSTATFIVAGGDKYTYLKTKMPTGLFDVGLYTMSWIAENDR